MKLNLTMFTLLFPLLWILTSCEKEPEIIIKTETVTIIDTLVVTDTFTIVDTIIDLHYKLNFEVVNANPSPRSEMSWIVSGCLDGSRLRWLAIIAFTNNARYKWLAPEIL